MGSGFRFQVSGGFLLYYLETRNLKLETSVLRFFFCKYIFFISYWQILCMFCGQ